ncbi:hypothetical protein B5M42_012530 [Paenibacillus athensensis]|uniref:beta-mannosidase n=1 Tax=Paenibacillus athensensis TaxID=1967502 RepID=A0A4Y8PY35_9BACL|nr:glycoside hydrolase family 2 TIM barrel-domain containing protein [Paenibacillus athensensis]MCD1259659.1 hypothetical protein [Paenibacillus athensensis]
MELSFREYQWFVKGFWPWVPVKGSSMEIGNELMGVTEWLPATVPGGVHQDLHQAGLIDHPYHDMNSLKCEWVENRWWVYKTLFERPAVSGSKVELVFKGLDYEAMIYLNHELLGEHKGMYHPAVFDITEWIERHDSFELLVVLKQAPDEMAQIGKTSETFTQKSRFNYKWDFSTRLVNVGIWDDVVLRVHQAYSLENVHVRTDVEQGTGLVYLSAGVVRQSASADEAAGLQLAARVLDPDGQVVATAMEPLHTLEQPVEFRFQLAAPRLWYPNGYGDQPLYSIEVQLLQGSCELDRYTCQTGIRKLAYAVNPDSPEGALPYTFVINGVNIYIRGVNMTPLDHLYGNVAESRYEWIVHLAQKAHVNMIRVWGGGIIEKSYFYELCDRHGILIWQEFVQSSSGVDNIPSKRPEYLELLARTAVEALRTRRNHVSLSVWSGGNELMSAPNTPSTYEDENLAMLKELTAKWDPLRMFLPTSASGPVQYITAEKGVSHDVHGHWKYQGNPQHYEIYGEADHLFHSEFGVDGVSSLKSLRKFLSPGHLRPTSMTDSLVWRHHGEWWDTYDRDLQLFGRLEELAAFVDCSQWIQAEGLRFILEANRRRQFHNSGSIVWQLNEPWPNASCTNLIDYYKETKMAYYWVKKAFAPDHVSLDYRKLNYAAGDLFHAPVYVHRNGGPTQAEVQAQVLDSHGAVLYTQTLRAAALENGSSLAGNLSFEVPETADGLVFVRLKLQADAARKVENVYIFSTVPAEQPLYGGALDLGPAKLDIQELSGWRPDGAGGLHGGDEVLVKRFRVHNAGAAAALFVHAEEQTDRYVMVADEAYEILFPGESQEIEITCTVRSGELFGERQAREAKLCGSVAEPVIAFHCFQSRTAQAKAGRLTSAKLAAESRAASSIAQ